MNYKYCCSWNGVNVKQNSCSKVKVFDYVKQKYVVLYLNSSQTCEDAIIKMCRNSKILPKTQLLFGICLPENYSVWIPLDSKLELKQRYCFRMRFRMEENELIEFDTEAHTYLFWQMCYDMRKERFKEMTYEKNKNELFGLAIMHMNIDIKLNKKKEKTVLKNYADYLSASLKHNHGSAAKDIMKITLEEMKSHIEVQLVMSEYIKQALRSEINYMLEKYVTTIDNWPAEWKKSKNSDTSSNDSVDNTAVNNKKKPSVSMEIDVTNESGPCLKICPKPTADQTLKPGYIYLDKIINISPVENNNIIKFDTEETAYRFQFENNKECNSFITYVNGYIRLTANWCFNSSNSTPSLCKLKKLKCHGPIGETHLKIYKKYTHQGGYAFRQCERNYFTYFVDIIYEKNSSHNFKDIDKISLEIKQLPEDKYQMNYEKSTFIGESLQALVEQIPSASNLKRLEPTDEDNSEKLLICYPRSIRNQNKKREYIFLNRTLTIMEDNFDIDKDTNNALWEQDAPYKDIKVTTDELQSFEQSRAHNIGWFIQVCSPYIMKLYGHTVPDTSGKFKLVFERHGLSLPTFLKENSIQFTISMRLQVLDSLAHSVLHLWNRKLVHGYLRSENLYVKSFDNNQLVVKLKRPLLPREYDKTDLPWLPLEDSMEKHIFADIWAFGTTVYELICKTPKLDLSQKELKKNYREREYLLPKEDVCEDLQGIFEHICVKCWLCREQLIDSNFGQDEILDMLKALEEHKENKNAANKNNA